MSTPDLNQYRFFSPARVRFAETDCNGHMSHVTPVIYMEQARADFLSGLGLFSIDQMTSAGKTFVLAKQTIEYQNQAYYYDQIDTYVRASRIGRSSIEMEYILFNRERGNVTATAQSIIVYFDVGQQKSTPLPSDLPDLINQFESRFASQQ
jgi:acyl-CoA thioester hydrolase